MSETEKGVSKSPSNLDSSSSSANDATDQEKDWATAAHREFTLGNYGASLSFINKLEAVRPKDPKVALNKIVVEYCKGDLKKTDHFRKSLSDLSSKAKINMDSLEGIEDAERSSFYLNHCVLLYHQQQYRGAMRILQKLFSCLDTLEESIGIGVCLLLIECQLALRRPDQAIHAISHTEATYLPQPLPPPAPSPKSHDKENRFERSPRSRSPEKEGNEVRLGEAQEKLRSRLHKMRVTALLMLRALRVAKKELKSILSQAVSASNPQQGVSCSIICLKSQLEYLRGNHKKAIKVLNQCATLTDGGGGGVEMIYYNNLGVMHLSLSKPTISLHYFRMAKEAMEKLEKRFPTPPAGEPLSGRPLYTLSMLLRAEVFYNLGIALLQKSQPQQAFQYFLEVVRLYPSNPRLWLRLTECCIGVHKQEQGVREDLSGKDAIRNLLQGHVGIGVHRKLCLTPRLNNHDKRPNIQQTTDSAFPEPTLEFAKLCVSNALTSLPENISTSPVADDQDSSGLVPELYSALPSTPMRGNEVLNVRVSCLACAAYISLCLAEYPQALTHAEALLTAHLNLSGPYKLLGHLYAAESLICLGRVSEAMPHLDPRLVEDMSFSLPSTTSPSSQPATPTTPSTPATPNQPSTMGFNSTNSSILPGTDGGWYPSSPGAAAAVMRYNLAVAYTLRGELEKANALLKEVFNEHNPNMPAQVIMLVMHIQLQLGHTDIMKNIVKKHVLT